MFDGCWSDRSLDKAEKQSRRVSKDFYPSPLKCHWALWSEPSFLCVLRTWWTSFTRFRKRISTHTHTQNLSVCLLWLSLWCAWGQLQNCTILPWHMLPYTLISMQTDAHSTFTVLHSREKLSNLIYCPWPPLLSELFDTDRVILAISWIQFEKELRFWMSSCVLKSVSNIVSRSDHFSFFFPLVFFLGGFLCISSLIDIVDILP